MFKIIYVDPRWNHNVDPEPAVQVNADSDPGPDQDPGIWWLKIVNFTFDENSYFYGQKFIL